jgi:hypothetical protein
MLVAHHRSIMRFAVRSTAGRQRIWLPLVAVALGARFVLACGERYLGTLRAHRSRPATGTG